MSIVPLSSLCSRAPGLPSTADHLTLSTLAEALARGAGGDRPVLVGVVPRGGLIDLRLHPIPQGLPEAVIGWHAPTAWRATGLVCPARSNVAGPGDVPTAGDISLAALVERDGRVVVAVSGSGLGQMADDGVSAEPLREPQGRLVDLCQRVLRLPTAPAAWSPGRLWTAVWYDAVLTLAIDRPRGSGAPQWRSVAACHPVPAALGVREALRPEHLIQLADHPLAESWEALRLASSAGQWHWPDTPDVAADWFDAGSFGRWLLQLYPAPGQLLAALGDVVAPSVHAAMRRVGEAWLAFDDEPALSTAEPSGDHEQRER